MSRKKSAELPLEEALKYQQTKDLIRVADLPTLRKLAQDLLEQLYREQQNHRTLRLRVEQAFNLVQHNEIEVCRGEILEGRHVDG